MTRRRAVGLLVVVAVAAGFALYGLGGLTRVLALRREVQALEREVGSLHQRADALAETIDRLRNDPAYIEKLAREEHGLVREDETVLKFPSKGR